jgi:hypothetical protein
MPLMTRVSEHFALGLAQPQLDFVDVDVATDTEVYVDPHALRQLRTEWGRDCVAFLQHYFRCVLAAIRAGDTARADELLGQLREPNQTRLGQSQGQPAGHALGPTLAADVRDQLARSEALRTGLIEDLEDTILMIPLIGRDLISDITTNVIREPLIRDIESLAAEAGLGHISRTAVSGICLELRDRYRAFRAKSLADIRLLSLMLDAIYLPVRPEGPKEGVLVAWGYTLEGERVLLDVCLGQRERTEDWLGLGRGLAARGLASPLLVVSDGAPGLIAAIGQLWPDADRQRCTVHRLRNVLAKLPKKPLLHERIRRAYWAALDGASCPQEAETRLRARPSCHSSSCSARIMPTRRMTAARLGKMPTTAVRRLISLLSRSRGLVLRI